MQIRILSRVALLIALYYLTYHVFVGLQNPIPALGDSWDYHIPIAQTLLDGRFLAPDDFELPQWYYPGSSEAINALFVLFSIPLTLSNIVATIALFLSLWRLGSVFRLERYYALLFSLSFVTLNVVVRWLNAVSIDVWLAVWFVLAIILLEQPKKSAWYFLQLGFVLGMLVGSKYTALPFLAVLLVFYAKRFLFVLRSVKHLLLFLLPFTLFGLFWYVRNYFFTGNPFYPLAVLGFEGTGIFADDRVWNVALSYPQVMFDSAFAEFKLWLFSIPIALVWLGYQYAKKKHYTLDATKKLLLLGLCNVACYLTFPTSEQSWIMVSSFRYSFPAFIPLFLGVFLLAKQYKKEALLGYFVLGNMLMVTSLAYYPKLALFYVPLAICIFAFMDRKRANKKKRATEVS